MSASINNIYCPNCSNLLDITKILPNKTSTIPNQQIITQTDISITNTEPDITTDAENLQIGGDDNKNAPNILTTFLINIENKNYTISKQDIPADINIDNLKDNLYFADLNPDTKEYIYNKLKDALDANNLIEKKENYKIAYQICKSCGYTGHLKPHTLIITRSIKENTVNTDTKDYSLYVNDPTLPITRNYICPNKECDSYSNVKKREAIFFRTSTNSYHLKYVCKTCLSVWNH